MCGHGSCNSCFMSFQSVSKEKRDRDRSVVQTFKDRQNLHKSLNGEMNWPSEEKKLAQQRVYEAETEAEAKHWEKRNSDIALFCEIDQEFESQRLQLQQANQWADQAQRFNISLCGELRNRLFRENQATYCQEFEEFVAKKQTEQDKQELMNCRCIKRGILCM